MPPPISSTRYTPLTPRPPLLHHLNQLLHLHRISTLPLRFCHPYPLPLPSLLFKRLGRVGGCSGCSGSTPSTLAPSAAATLIDSTRYGVR
ncbi:hypothetical protein COCMIDRAFT_10486 [Bipolaris oryzae ATCC 44560]|uniref:Uncharacterized protein n=1 Tax=Bipolaris oryzae ATCC 44560 TaxID=930090 RepID=W6Z6Z2_COCMI|nr:uncharacterized protein COCMIDRAFT_10486 [Bipolaris oryzae ATCC 44560]EUC39451.1 hypothetical protein COCMIDRAFT_10486 [Bipolaris oryzae ATCC 44560]